MGGFSEHIIMKSTIYPVLNGHHSTESEGEVHLVARMLKHESNDEWWNCMGADTYNWVMLPKGKVSITGSSRPQWLDVNV